MLAQVELALILLHLALDVGLDLVTQFDDLELYRQEQRELTQPLLGVALFEDRLAIARIETHRRSDEVGQEIGVADVVDFHLHLARRLRQIAQQLLEERAEIAVHRDELFGVFRFVGKLRVGRSHVRIGLNELIDLEDAGSGNDAPQRPVGHLEHLLNDTDRADLAHVVGTGVLGLFLFENDEADLLAFAQGLLDQGDAGLLDDRQRDHGVREEHRFLEREYADDIGGFFFF